MDCSMPGLPVLHHLPELAQTHVHLVSDAILCNHLFPFSSRLQSFPASGSFPMSQLFTSGGHSIGASASASVLPMSIQGWFSLGWIGLISLQSKGLSRVFPNTTVWKDQFFWCSANFHVCTWLQEKTIALTRWIFVCRVTSLFFNMLSAFVIIFLARRAYRALISADLVMDACYLDATQLICAEWMKAWSGREWWKEKGVFHPPDHVVLLSLPGALFTFQSSPHCTAVAFHVYLSPIRQWRARGKGAPMEHSGK